MHPLLESTYDAIKALMLELATLFPDPYIHLGGDQVRKERYLSQHANVLSLSLSFFFISFSLFLLCMLIQN